MTHVLVNFKLLLLYFYLRIWNCTEHTYMKESGVFICYTEFGVRWSCIYTLNWNSFCAWKVWNSTWEQCSSEFRHYRKGYTWFLNVIHEDHVLYLWQQENKLLFALGITKIKSSCINTVALKIYSVCLRWFFPWCIDDLKHKKYSWSFILSCDWKILIAGFKGIMCSSRKFFREFFSWTLGKCCTKAFALVIRWC